MCEVEAKRAELPVGSRGSLFFAAFDLTLPSVWTRNLVDNQTLLLLVCALPRFSFEVTNPLGLLL